jgi:hypothetical protein
MAEETNTATEDGRQDGFVKGLSKAVARKAVVPLAASISSAGTAYLTKKSSQLWNEKVLPKVREKGGGRAVAGDVVDKVAGKLGGRSSEALSALAERVRTPSAEQSGTRRPAQGRQASSTEAEQSDERRAEERRERRERRQQRQRTLEQSGPS